MSLTRWLSERLGLSRIRELAARPASPRKRPTFRPALEALEERWVLSTLTVLNNLDSGAGSLRADVAAAHNGDTINFAASLNGQTITLTSGELLIKKNLTIAGPGAGELTVSGNKASRVFEVAKMENVTLSGLTISNGSANGSTTSTIQGGAIYNHGTLTVSNSTLSYNTASNNGGGIANDGTLTVSGSTLSGNSSPAGGGILTSGSLTVSGSTLSGNSADHGGGIFNGGTLTVSGSTLSGNSGNYGGGIYNGGTLTVSGSTLSGNFANNGGGGIYNGGTLTVSGSTLSGNSAQQLGGGIANFGTLTVSGSTLSGNSATYSGGGIYDSVYGTATVKNSSSITGNTAPAGFGADVYNLGVLYLDSTSIIGILDGNPAMRI
jgi:hypothetical protein